MDSLVSQLIAVVVALAAFLVGPGIAISFLLLRKRRRRLLKRSPIGRQLLRSPGHSLREQIDTLQNDITWDVLTVALMPLMILCLYLMQRELGVRAPHAEWIYGTAALAFIAWATRTMVRRGEKLDNLRAGYDAEMAVGEELDQLMRSGAVVFHDVPGENFNIDHVVVLPNVIAAVENKGYTKQAVKKGKAAATVQFDGQQLQFPTFTTGEPLDQSARQAEWLARWLSSAVGERVTVQPVLALPGWYVERKGRGAVLVCSGRELEALRSVRGMRLEEELIRRVAHQLDQRCRTVEPSYRGDGKAD